MKTLGVVGLGLIGGSFVKAYRETKDWRVLGTDKNDKIQYDKNGFPVMPDYTRL